MDATKVFTVLLLIIFILFLILVGPFFTIWSFNTLFKLEIPYTIYTWAAVAWLTAVLNGIRVSLKNQN